MKSIGITGGIGSGKSMVCKILETLGFPVFYADSEAKKVMNSDETLKSGIIGLLGDAAYQDNALNRPFVAEKIFGDHALRKSMDSLVHPAVFRAFDQWKAQQHAALIFNESALMFETGSYKRFDATVLVTADQETRIARVIKRDSVTREQVLARISHQLSDEAKRKLCSAVIVNDEDVLLIPQVLEMVERFSKS